MILFIDESGTHKSTGYSSISIVQIGKDQLEIFNDGIKNVLADLKITEFHWARQGWEVKRKFFKKTANLSFTFKYGIFHNPASTNKMIAELFNSVISKERIERLYIDGGKSKWFERRLKKILRDNNNSIGKLRPVKNEISFPGIQMADAIAGLTRYYFDNPHSEDAATMYDRLERRGKIVDKFIQV